MKSYIKEITSQLRFKKETCERYFNREINSLTDFYQIGLYIGEMNDVVNSHYVANLITAREREKIKKWIDAIDSYYFRLIQDSFHNEYLVKKD